MRREHRNVDDGSENRGFESFYNRNYKAVSNYVARRLPQHLHDDVVAATFTVAWRKFGKASDPSLPWLYRIAGYEVAHELRKLARSQPVDQLREDLTPRHEEQDEVYDVIRALDQLPGDDAELLRLLHWDRLSRSQAANLLGCSVSTLNVRYHRATERLAGALHRQLNIDAPVKVQTPVEDS